MTNRWCPEFRAVKSEANFGVAAAFAYVKNSPIRKNRLVAPRDCMA
jgi:hypothetical protein